MKRILVILFSLGLAYGASAQRGHFAGGGFYHGGGRVVVVPRTYVGVGFGFGYPWGYPYGWYGPWGLPYPPYYYGYGAMPSQLELQVRDIRQDYDQQIKDVKHDKSLTKQERRAKVDQLKKEKEDAIVQARHDYFDRSRRNYNPQPNNNQPNSNQPNNNEPKNGSSSGDGPEYQSGDTGSK
ncbi:MAG TPA: hypothetical protein VHE34_08045 [Puia sp.]|uniref:hypothetical protein n=1 Tax=Puia sp. TaxID=2045100 RepID=UPI002CD72D1A|nr:hypothetical protein [Puia sp.]HVU95158.1 hypothetical protein [Puia sp.]